MVEVGEQIEAVLDRPAVRQMCPVPPMDVPRGEAVFDVTTADFGEDGPGGCPLALRAGRVKTAGVAFQEMREGDGADQCLLRNRACAAIGEVIDKGDAGNEFPMLG